MVDCTVMDIVSRKDAKELGLTRFYDGIECKHGHTVERYTSTSSCVECQLNHSRANNPKYTEKNREKLSQWQKNNKEHLRTYHKKWRDANPDKVAVYNKKRKQLRNENKSK